MFDLLRPEVWYYLFRLFCIALQHRPWFPTQSIGGEFIFPSYRIFNRSEPPSPAAFAGEILYRVEPDEEAISLPGPPKEIGLHIRNDLTYLKSGSMKSKVLAGSVSCW